MKILLKDLGLIDYMECWTFQEKIFDGLVEKKAAGHKEIADGKDYPQPTVILCEHPHVYTLGRSGQQDNMLISEEFLQRIGAAFYRTDRGGDITYHGPGQLVGYPILDLEKLGLGLKEYVHTVEEAVIRTIGDYGISGQRSEGATGVWLPRDAKGGLRKISAIGVRSSRYVTMHGFSLNVNPQMEYFGHINPCGFTDRGVTSMEKELGEKVEMAGVKERFLAHFGRLTGTRIVAGI